VGFFALGCYGDGGSAAVEEGAMQPQKGSVWMLAWLLACAFGGAIYFATVAHVVEPFVRKKSAQQKFAPKKV